MAISIKDNKEKKLKKEKNLNNNLNKRLFVILLIILIVILIIVILIFIFNKSNNQENNKNITNSTLSYPNAPPVTSSDDRIDSLTNELIDTNIDDSYVDFSTELISIS